MYARNRRISSPPDGSAVAPTEREPASTLVVLNEVYSRLLASAKAYEHACAQEPLGAIKTWMTSFGQRLEDMAERLRDEGARPNKSFERSAAALMTDEACSSPAKLLEQAELNQQALLDGYDVLTGRLDMDADLYELITEQYDELGEVLNDMSDLRLEYETYAQLRADG